MRQARSRGTCCSLATIAAGAVLSATFQYAAAQTASGEPQTTAPRSGQIEETLPLTAPGGAAQKLTVDIDDWHLHPGTTEISLPPGGAAVIGVIMGRVSVTMGSSEKAFQTGDYWSVPGGTKMSVSVQPQLRGAILRTITGSSP